MKRKSRKIRRWIALTVLAVFVATWLPVLALRWLNPPTTAFMLEAAAHDHTQVAHRWVPYRAISPAMRLAVVASEDQTFPDNHGFDITAIRKAIKHNAGNDTLHGASTITQQVAKNLFLWPARSWLRKGIGAYFTVLIDLTWPKRRVLEVYLNIAQFGPRIFGVDAAARHYFGIHANALSRAQAALLAATLPDPRQFDPAAPSDYLRRREAWILTQMDQLGAGYLADIQ